MNSAFKHCFIVKFDSNGVLLNNVVLSGSRLSSGYAQHYDNENNELWTIIHSNQGDTLVIQDSIIPMNPLSTNIVLARWDSELNLLKTMLINSKRAIFHNMSMSVDHNNDVLVVGTFMGEWLNINGDTTIYSSVGDEHTIHGVLLKLSMNGKLLWSRIFSSDESMASLNEVKLGRSGIYVCGNFSGDELMISQFRDTLLKGFRYTNRNAHYWQCKLDHDGNLMWVRGFDMNTYLIPYMDLDASERILSHWIINRDTVYILGNIYYRTNPELDFSDALLTIQDTDGDLIWAYKYGGGLLDATGPVKFSDDGDIVISGSYESDSIPFFNGMLYNKNPKDRHNSRPSKIFVARVFPDITTSVFDVFPELETLNLYPSPNGGVFKVEGLTIKKSVKIYDLGGRPVEYTRDNNVIHLNQPVAGTYVVIVKSEDGSAEYGKVVISR